MSTHEGDETREPVDTTPDPTRPLENAPAEPRPVGPEAPGTAPANAPTTPATSVTDVVDSTGRPSPRSSTMALGIILAVLAVAATLREVTGVGVDGGVLLIGLMIGIGILFLVGSRRA